VKRPSVFWARTGRWLWSGSRASFDNLLSKTHRDIGSQGKLPGIGKRGLHVIGNMQKNRFGEEVSRPSRDTNGRNFIITHGGCDEPEPQQPNILTYHGKMLRFPEPLQLQPHGTFGQSGNRWLGIPDGDQQLEMLTRF
jgi:hypothetical protein